MKPNKVQYDEAHDRARNRNLLLNNTTVGILCEEKKLTSQETGSDNRDTQKTITAARTIISKIKEMISQNLLTPLLQNF